MYDKAAVADPSYVLIEVNLADKLLYSSCTCNSVVSDLLPRTART